MKAVLCFGGKFLNKELFEIFGFNPDTLSASAFVQQRSKIKPEAFSQLFNDFLNSNQKDCHLQSRMSFSNSVTAIPHKNPTVLLFSLFPVLVLN